MNHLFLHEAPSKTEATYKVKHILTRIDTFTLGVEFLLFYTDKKVIPTTTADNVKIQYVSAHLIARKMARILEELPSSIQGLFHD